ncbi:MAG TPA: nitroreductase family protein [Bacteroidales bacterium]|nr:nitroreductase family protein [Bacteroidales bacterium]HQG55767.1 nitroreductase family protein [Bacteroidales bacterium]
MKNRLISLIFFIIISFASALNGQQAVKSATEVILSGYSVRMFAPGTVSDSDIELILKCGIKAPSARNLQPWWFTVVKDQALLKELMPNITEGNILIIISGREDARWAEYDCGLATQNMYVAAQSLGLGAHIYAGPVESINTSKKEVLGIPSGYRAIMVLRIGHIDKNVDAVSAASPRKSIQETVNFK